jgi:hypothetical protein
MVRTFLVSVILVGAATLAQAQTAAAPLVVTATVVSSCKTNVPRQVKRSALSTMTVDIACARGSRGGVDARVRRPLSSPSSVGHALVLINF